MSAASPKTHDASGCGRCKMGTLSRWHHERGPQLSQSLKLPRAAPAQWVDNQPTCPRVEDSLLKR